MRASTYEEYQLVLRYSAPDYEVAFSIQLGGFPSYEVYEYARYQGLLTFEDFLKKNKFT